MIATIDLPKRVYYGPNSLNKLGEVITELQLKHVFVILSERNKSKYGEIFKSTATLHSCDITFSENLSGEPTTLDVSRNVKRFRNTGADSVLGFGGGSAIDLAKAVAVFAKHRMSLKRLMDLDDGTVGRYPLIAIPTTAGSGSEATKVFVITDEETKTKYNPANSNFIPDVSILDPVLTYTLPEQITIETSVDALAHALEALVSTRSSAISEHYALKALQIHAEAFRDIQMALVTEKTREHLLLASHFAGIAFSNASTNLAHATARALGTMCNISHGLSVALTLPHVVSFSYESAKDKYQKVEQLFNVENFAQFLNELNVSENIINQARKKIDTEQLKNNLPQLVKNTLSGNGILTNRRVPSKEDVERIFEKIIENLMEVR